MIINIIDYSGLYNEDVATNTCWHYEYSWVQKIYLQLKLVENTKVSIVLCVRERSSLNSSSQIRFSFV